MLASIPASILNHIRHQSGIPPDSEKIGHALGAHARDELGISEAFSARPIQAALASACSFSIGAAMPLLVTATVPASSLIYPGPWNFSPIPRAIGCIGCARGRRGCDGGRIARHILGRFGHGVTAGVGAGFGTIV